MKETPVWVRAILHIGIQHVDNIYDDYRASGRQGQEGVMQVTDQENTTNASITEGKGISHLITMYMYVYSWWLLSFQSCMKASISLHLRLHSYHNVHSKMAVG